MTDFYVYGHYKKDTGELFYIGKGVGDRAYKKTSRNRWWTNVVNKHGIEIKLLYKGLTEKEAHAKEMKLIVEYGRQNLGTGSLVNMTDGGEGISNPCEETRRKMSEAARNRSEKTIRNMSEAQKGKLLSEKTRQKISESVTGKKHPMFGKHHTEEAKRKMSDVAKNRSEETRRKMSQALIGRYHTEETKRKMSASAKCRRKS